MNNYMLVVSDDSTRAKKGSIGGVIRKDEAKHMGLFVSDGDLMLVEGRVGKEFQQQSLEGLREVVLADNATADFVPVGTKGYVLGYLEEPGRLLLQMMDDYGSIIIAREGDLVDDKP